MGSKKEEVPMTNMEKLKYGCFVALGWDHVLSEFARVGKFNLNSRVEIPLFQTQTEEAQI